MTHWAIDEGNESMTMHLRTVSRPRVATAEEGATDTQAVLLQFLNFAVAILAALDGLFTRKTENPS
jgi:hypothetical protein